MEDLIKVLQIFLRCGNPRNPTHCEHDELTICGIDPENVSAEDIETLNKLGFFVDSNGEYFMSFRSGSA